MNDYASYAASPGFDPYAGETGWFGSKLVRKIGKAAGSVAKAVGSIPVVKSIPGVSIARAQLRFVSDIAQGRNILNSAKRAGSGVVSDVRAGLPVAASAVAFIPGVGSGVGAGLNAAAALSRGQNLSQIARAAAMGAIPGGALINAGLQTGYNIARGGNVLRSLASGAISAIPGGPIGQAAAAALQAGVRGQSLASVAEAAARGAIPANILAAVDISRDVLKGKNVLKATLSQAAVAFVPNSPELGGFNSARAILSGAGASAAALAAARAGLRSEGARRAFDSAVGTASKAAAMVGNSAPARFASLPTSVARLGAARVGAQFRPLTPRAAQVVANRVPFATFGSLYGRSETAGLTADGVTYTVEKGDSAWAIANKLVKAGNRYRELFAANASKPVDPKTGNWKTLFPGEKLNVPSSWRVVLAPAIKADTLAQARALLAVWSQTDGANQAGVTDYGSKPEDASLVWGPRDRLMLISFANWRNRETGKKLSVVGDLSDPLADELRLWASEHASASNLPAIPAALPQLPTSPAEIIPAINAGLPALVAAAPAAITQALPQMVSAASTASPGGGWVPPVPVSPAIEIPPIPAPQNPLSGTRSTPDDISAMAAAAQSSGNVATMRQVANELFKRGFKVESDKLNASADELEARQFGVPSPTVMAPMTVTGTAPTKPPAVAKKSTGDDLGPLAIAALVIAKLAHVI